MKKIIILVLSLLLCFACISNIYANSNKIVDEAGILSEAEKTNLNAKINAFIQKTNYDIVIYITKNNEYLVAHESDDDAITRLADDYYDENGYGIGSDYDGLIILLDVGQRNYTITTCGSSCIDCFTDSALDRMYSNITSCFRNNDWYGGLCEFVDGASYVYDNYDYYHQSYEPEKPSLASRLLKAGIPAIIGAIIITLISFNKLKKELKTSGVGVTAANYLASKKINLTRSGEVYLYTTTSRVRVEHDEPSHSSGGHSTTHISSSGRSHGGGGSHRF